jgi:2-oxoisovalerate dehydrogenase E1 component
MLDFAYAQSNLRGLRQFLLNQGFPQEELQELETTVRNQVQQAVTQVQKEPEPAPTMLAKAPYPIAITERQEYRGDSSSPRLTLREAINGVLKSHLAQDPNVFLYGQDIEDPKGDVFGVTKGLSTAFPNRVVNACLSESPRRLDCVAKSNFPNPC